MREPLLLLFLLYLYTVLVALTVALPATDLPFFASIRLRSILEIRQALESKPSFFCVACQEPLQSR